MEFIGKTVDEAIKAGLLAMELTEEQAEITVKQEPTRGLFGKLKGQAVVDITAKPVEEVKVETVKAEKKPAKKQSVGDLKKEREFLEKLLSLMEYDAKIEESVEDGNPVFTLIAEDSSAVIGYRGEVLDAIQTLVGSVANIGKKDYKKVVVDCENYRNRREETLIKLAHKLEEKATEIRREVYLEPMSPFERRIIHTALADSTTVTTRSDGQEPNRFVIIVPNDKDEYSKPYNAGRNHEHGDRRDGNRGGRGRDRRDRNSGRRNNNGKGGSGFIETKKKSSISFGTYLGNSLKDE